MSKPVSYQLDVYGVWMHLARTRGEWRKLSKRENFNLRNVRDVFGRTAVLTPDGGGVHVAVYVDVERLGKQALVETCAHEAAHAAALMCEAIGAEVTGDSEHLAYLVGWTTAWLWANARR